MNGDVVNGLVTEGLCKAFGPVPVLSGVDLEVPAGSFTAVLGPSGSGKTTLLRVIAGFERADAGTVVLGGVVVDGPDRYMAPDQRGI
ncbi:MAG TPA: ATP-binding cassette domain-containing protein, partial [Acidimicrobiales bacterium]|nr:ATP-binding cassette domain-containing protein [Acidimicrobiales bacterium]